VQAAERNLNQIPPNVNVIPPDDNSVQPIIDGPEGLSAGRNNTSDFETDDHAETPARATRSKTKVDISEVDWTKDPARKNKNSKHGDVSESRFSITNNSSINLRNRARVALDRAEATTRANAINDAASN
jgi:hypothetical protein